MKPKQFFFQLHEGKPLVFFEIINKFLLIVGIASNCFTRLFLPVSVERGIRAVVELEPIRALGHIIEAELLTLGLLLDE